MSEISKITLPNGTSYDLKDAKARESIETIKSNISSGIHYIGETDEEINDGDLFDAGGTFNIKKGNYTDAIALQSGDLVIYNEKEFICTINKEGQGTWHEFGSTGSLKSLAFKDSASASYTPAGTVSQPTFTGKSTPVSVSGTATVQPKATLAFYDPGATAPAHTGAATGTYVQGTPKAKATGTAVSLSTASIKQITNVGTAPALTTTVSGETLTLGWNAGTLPTSATVTVATGVSSVTQPTITVGGIDLTLQSVSSTVASSGSMTPVGTVSKPTFAGTAATITSK